MKFSLIHPSRSRPEKSLCTIDKWFSNRCKCGIEAEIIVSLDVDDPELDKYNKLLFHLKNIIVNKNRSVVDAINNAAKVATGDVFIIVSDDTACPRHWDKILTDAIGQSKDFVIKTDDGIQKRIITMPIMDRAYYNRDGYIYNPIYAHSWCDTELTEVAHLRGRVITRMDIKFPHNHYSVTGEAIDDLYKRNNLTHDRDRPIYQQRKKINFGL